MIKLDTRNSRMKDFHDVWALAGAFAFDGEPLQRAVAACFERHGTPWTDEAPRVLTTAFFQTPDLEARWRNYLAAGSVLVPPPAQFGTIGERIIEFLGPVREWILSKDRPRATWSPGGPWSQQQSPETR
ncbi:MAG: nucleotidyl transferase AbiEii/AbiGii toxin family protein [Gemmatimonadaceae bacterium]|nr:nucleotidyl transferase AbiEii/AbiGii toxin family protein [Gemmatimonadaceae bacterium]